MFTKEQANKYIAENKNSVNSLYKPKFHFAPEIGWINDPNGFCKFNGEYHLFYQFHPYSSQWGPMHWGHAKSENLLKWEHLPVALAPDSDFDKDGCFSGSTIIYGKYMYLCYTGVHDGKQEQCLARSLDGVNFEKLGVIIGEENLAKGLNIRDFRDPKIFKQNESFYCIIGANKKAVVYKSENLLKWNYCGDLLEKELGEMFECPDYFCDIDTNGIKNYAFISSICGKNSENLDNNKFIFFANPTYFILEDGDLCNLHKKYRYFDELESGFDFYAPQTLANPDFNAGEPNIIIAWAYTFGKKIATHELNHGWANCMNLPREIYIKNDKILQTPIRNIAKYRQNKTVYKNFVGEIDLPKCAEFDIIANDNLNLNLINLNLIIKDGKLIFERLNNCEFFDMRSNEEREKDIKERRILEFESEKIELKIIIDVSILEIFLKDGRVISSRIYPDFMRDYAIRINEKIANLEIYEIVV